MSMSPRSKEQLVPNVSLSLSYIYHKVTNLYNSLEGTTTSTASGINILRPYSIYTVPVTLTDTLNGNPVTLYTYPASYSSSSFNQFEVVNAPGDRPDTYNTFEVAVTKRYSKRWNGQFSFWTTKNHRVDPGDQPQSQFRPIPDRQHLELGSAGRRVL